MKRTDRMSLGVIAALTVGSIFCILGFKVKKEGNISRNRLN